MCAAWQGCGRLQADVAERAMAALSQSAGQDAELPGLPPPHLGSLPPGRRPSTVPDIKLPPAVDSRTLLS